MEATGYEAQKLKVNSSPRVKEANLQQMKINPATGGSGAGGAGLGAVLLSEAGSLLPGAAPDYRWTDGQEAEAVLPGDDRPVPVLSGGPGCPHSSAGFVSPHLLAAGPAGLQGLKIQPPALGREPQGQWPSQWGCFPEPTPPPFPDPSPAAGRGQRPASPTSPSLSRPRAAL